ncbi:MAG: hypothetical protein ACPGVS_07865 [Primorskyibacter sp.]
MPKLIRMYIIHAMIGFGLSALFVAALLYFNIANLRHLVMHTQGGGLAVGMLWVLNGTVFAGVQFGVAVMLMRGQDHTPRGGGRRQMAPRSLTPVLAPIRARAPSIRDVLRK